MEKTYLENEIDKLEKLFAEINELKLHTTQEKYLSHVAVIEEEYIRIKDDIWKSIFMLGLDQFRISSFIDYQLNKIIDLSDELYLVKQDFIGKLELDDDIQLRLDLFGLLLNRLNDLIDYLQGKFKAHFNPSLKPPLAYVEMVTDFCKSQTKEVISKLKKAEVSLDVISVLENYFDNPLAINSDGDFIKDGFHRLEYFQTLSKSLFNICNTDEPAQLENKVKIELIYLNFNWLDYIWLCIKKLKPEYTHLTDIDREVTILTLYKNEIIHLPMKHNYGYETDAIPLKDLVIKMLKEEIKFLKKQNKLEKNYKPIRGNAVHGDFYFEVNFTLKELLFYFRLLVEAGFVVINTRTGIFNFISNHIKTKKYSNLSVGSMKRKFNQNDQKAIKNIRSAMLTMIRLINEKYLFTTLAYCIVNGSYYCPQIP